MRASLDWLQQPAARPSAAARREAEARQKTLTKPVGALGRMESLAVRLAALQATARPRADRVSIVVFAADHGVAAEGVSAYPQAVTGQMVRNLARGGAAINVLARALGAALEIVNLGTIDDPGPLERVRSIRLAAGTANFTEEPAMTADQLAAALAAGRAAAKRTGENGADVFIGGDMGIGNTTATTALASALLNAAPESLVGPGTGLDAAGLERKLTALRRALARHRDHLDTPLEVLRRLGGFEIAGLVGSFIGCAQLGLPVLVDGFIATGAALVAAQLHPNTRDWLLFAHTSAEPGHRTVLAALDAQPLLDLGLRLGEGTGAAAAVPLLRMACALHNDMATFGEAGVSHKVD